MFAVNPRKHLENTNQREASDIFVAFAKSDRKCPNLCPEPVNQVGDGGVCSRKILASSAECSHQLLCIMPKLN
jgi:hypothetical protein